MAHEPHVALLADARLGGPFNGELLRRDEPHDLIEMLPSFIHTTRVVRQHHKGIFLLRLSGPVQKKPVDMPAITLLQNVRVNAQLFVIRIQPCIVFHWPGLRLEIQ